jgi:hypothetical protein
MSKGKVNMKVSLTVKILKYMSGLILRIPLLLPLSGFMHLVGLVVGMQGKKVLSQTLHSGANKVLLKIAR